MSMHQTESMPCRYCRADNLEASSQCWLCDARDWKPTSSTPMKARAYERPAPSSPTGVNSKAMAWALGLTLLLVGIGLGADYLGLAIVVSAVWWMTIAYTVARHGRFDATDVVLTFARAIVGMITLSVLLCVAVVAFFLIACFSSGPMNFH